MGHGMQLEQNCNRTPTALFIRLQDSRHHQNPSNRSSQKSPVDGSMLSITQLARLLIRRFSADQESDRHALPMVA
jgi:hypothetical protein